MHFFRNSLSKHLHPLLDPIVLKWTQDRHKPSRGFALIIAITLMAFIFLLLLSLATNVGMSRTSNQQSLKAFQAKQNALFAMKVALGNLQKHTGPDQRVTARADILDTDPATETIDGVNEPYWVGAWDAAEFLTDGVTANTNYERRLDWLVSASPRTPAPDEPWRTTADPITGPTDPNNTVTLVRSNLPGSSVGRAELEVSVETLPLAVDSSDSGAYAWWIGDEGVKARLDIEDAWQGATSLEELRRRYRTAQRNRIEGLTEFAPFFDITDPTFAQNLDKVSSWEQLRLLDSGNPLVTDALQEHFHNVSLYSSGLFTNTRDGGLRIDLSRGLYDKDADLLTYLNTAQGHTRLFDVAGEPVGSLPEWQMLQSYAQLSDDIITTGSIPEIQARRHRVPQFDGASTHGVYPLIQRYVLEFYARMDYVEDPVVNAPRTPDARYRMRLGIRPIIVLANPHNVRIAPAQYRIGNAQYYNGIRWYAAPGGSKTITRKQMRENMSGTRGWYHEWYFVTESVALEPGEAVYFTLPTSSNWQDEPRSPGTELYTGHNVLERGVRFSNQAILELHTNDSAVETTYSQINNNFYFGSASGGSMFISLKSYNWGYDYDPAGSPIHLWDNPSYNPTAIDQQTGDYMLMAIDGPGYATWATDDIRSADFVRMADDTSTGPSPGAGHFDLILQMDVVPRNSQYAPKGTPISQAEWVAASNIRYNFGNNNSDTIFIDDQADNRNSWASDDISFDSLGNWGYTTDASGYRSPWGPSLNPNEDTDGSGGGSGQNPGQFFNYLFDIPLAPLTSIAELQHANLFNISRTDASGTIQPAYAIGHSFADFGVGGARTISNDYIYQANRQLWDGYFFSTIHSTYTNAMIGITPLPNGRIRFLRDSLGNYPATADFMDFEQNAAHLTQQGAFNVNSVSTAAWETLLTGRNGIQAVINEPTTGLRETDSTTEALENPFSRVTHPGGAFFDHAATPPDDVDFDGQKLFFGGVSLTDAQVETLVQELVRWIKLYQLDHGRPILSIADFVNRWLRSGETDENSFGILERALADSGIRANFEALHTRGARAPGHLSQADILQTVGPVLTARSDTFTIRGYGAAVNPITSERESEAWCEAVVQRDPQYIDSSQTPDTRPANLNPINANFGRRYQVIAFRWLNADEL